MKLTLQPILFAVLLLIVATAAAPVSDAGGIELRSEQQHLMDRAVGDEGILNQRSLSSEDELSSRGIGSFFKKAFGGVKSMLGFRRAEETLNARSVGTPSEELASRGFGSFFKKAFGGVKSMLGFRRDEVFDTRSEDELYGRSEELFYARSEDDLSSRGIGSFFKKAFGGVKSMLGFRRGENMDVQLSSRSEYELTNRGIGSFFKKAFGGVKSMLGFRREELVEARSEAEDELYSRSEDEIYEIYGRSEELYGRAAEEETFY